MKEVPFCGVNPIRLRHLVSNFANETAAELELRLHLFLVNRAVDGTSKTNHRIVRGRNVSIIFRKLLTANVDTLTIKFNPSKENENCFLSCLWIFFY